MSSGTVPRQLARAARRYYTQQDVSAESTILPVHIVEDSTDGPYPPCILWHTTMNQIAVLANYSVVVIRNTAPRGSGSVLIVDRLYVLQTSAAGDINIGVFGSADQTAGAVGGPSGYSRNLDDQPLYNRTMPVVGNVLTYTLATLVPPAPAILYPHRQLIPVLYEGPWIVAADGEVAVNPSLVNTQLVVAAQGRYYDLS